MKKIKKLGFNGKVALAVANVVVFFTIFISIINVGIDPSHFNFIDWLGKIAINVVLALVTMFAGEAFYISFCTVREDGKYQNAKDKYDKAIDEINGRTQYLGQYLRIKHKNEVKNANLNYLVDHGIENAQNILKLDILDIPNLNKPYKKVLDDGTELVFKSYTKNQIKEIEYVLKGNVIVKRVPKSFYLDIDNDKAGRSDYVQAGYIESEKSFTKHIGRILKVVGMVGISILMATLTVNDFMKGDDLQAWFNLISRVASAIGGFYSGCRNSYRVNEIDVRAIRLKTTLLKEYKNFINEKPDYFKVTDEEYDAAEAYEKAQLENKNSNSAQLVNPVMIEPKAEIDQDLIEKLMKQPITPTPSLEPKIETIDTNKQ